MVARAKLTRRHSPPLGEPRKLGRVLNEEFACDRREQSLQLHECLTDYVNANALQTRTSPCFKCERGLENRVDFAKGRI